MGAPGGGADADEYAPFSGGVATGPAPGDLGVSLVVVPNPVGASAEVRLTLDRAGDVQIEVVDVLGRTVGTVASGLFPGGASVVRWLPGDLPRASTPSVPSRRGGPRRRP